ncbi:MAG: putative transrane protein [Proteobacteria bacterium]|nr:putative transrane protein [Pseudomonadota bacterium]
MKNQRGIALSGLLFWSIVIVLVAVLGLKVAPTVIEYQKIMKDAKATAAKVGPDSTVGDVRAAFDKFAEIDMLDFKASQLDISKENGKIVISFEYEKRIPLFWNVSLVIDYKGSTAG